MVGELLKFILDNAGKFGAIDVVLLLVVAGSMITSAVALLHWIYKKAFETQGEVIRSQDKLIELKDKAIATYERDISQVSAEHSRVATRLDDVSKQFEDLKSQHEKLTKEKHLDEAAFLLFAATHNIGVLIAAHLYYRLDLCHNLRNLVWAYLAIRAERKDLDGPAPEYLFARVDRTERFYLDQLQVLTPLRNLRKIEMQEVTKYLRPIIDANKRTIEARPQVHELEDFLVASTMPTLRKYEPMFAEKVQSSHAARKV